MIATQNISLSYSGKPLFKNVNIKFTAGNCYGIIGANGTGKSTFLKVLSGELEPTTGEVVITPGERMAVLRQNHFEFDSYEVLQTVIMGHKRLYEIMKEKDELYAKEDFTDADGERASELEGEFAELDGWSAESNAETILTGLGISLDLEHKLMSELDGSQKVKVLLAQALFGNPDILLLDEPTNYLDIQSVRWLENFLLDFPNTVIVVSHDRHFLNKVCTHICDIDFGKIQMYVGNYDFWYEYTQMVARQQKDIDKKNEQKIKELQTFIQRFSANASKHKQATSRKKLLDNLQMENYYTPSSRRYPYIAWKPDRDIGNDLLTVTNLSKTVNGRKVLNNISFVLTPGDKVAFVGTDELARTTLFQILMGEMEPDEGSFKWGVTTSRSYFPKDNGKYFDNCEYNLIDWLRQFSQSQYESDIRGWLGGRGGAQARARALRRREGALHAGAHDALRRERADSRRADEPPRFGIHHGAEQGHDRIYRLDALCDAGSRMYSDRRQPHHGDPAGRPCRSPRELRRLYRKRNRRAAACRAHAGVNKDRLSSPLKSAKHQGSAHAGGLTQFSIR